MRRRRRSTPQWYEPEFVGPSRRRLSPWGYRLYDRRYYSQKYNRGLSRGKDRRRYW